MEVLKLTTVTHGDRFFRVSSSVSLFEYNGANGTRLRLYARELGFMAELLVKNQSYAASGLGELETVKQVITTVDEWNPTASVDLPAAVRAAALAAAQTWLDGRKAPAGKVLE